MQHTRIQLLQTILNGNHTGIDLGHLALHLRNLVIQRNFVKALGDQILHHNAQPLLQFFQGRRIRINPRLNAVYIQAVHTQFRLQLCPGGIHLNIFLAAFDLVNCGIDLLPTQAGAGPKLGEDAFKLRPDALQLLGGELQLFQLFDVGRKLVDLRFQFVDGIPQNLHDFQNGLQLGLCGLKLDQLVIQLCPCGQKLVALLVDLRLACGSLLRKGILTRVQLQLCRRHLGLCILQLFHLAFQLPGSLVQLCGNRLADFFVQYINFILIQNDMQLLLHRAGGGNTRHAGDALQLVHQRFIQKFRQLRGQHSLHRHCRHFNRQHRGIDLQNIGRTHHLVPSGRQGTDGLLDIHTDGIQIHRFLKFQHDHTVVFTGCGGDLLDMLQCGHGLLHGLGDLRLHLLRAGTGIGGHNHHIGEIHIGQQIRRHFEIRHHTQHQYGNHRHKNGKGLFNTELRHIRAPTFRETGKNKSE